MGGLSSLLGLWFSPPLFVVSVIRKNLFLYLEKLQIKGDSVLKLSDSNFYYLELKDNKFVFSNYEKAVGQLKDRMDNLDTENLGENDIGLFEVNIDDRGEWTIKETSWFEFALELMKGN